MKILLFDVDQTLLYTGGCGKRALEHSYKQVFGVDNGMAGIKVAGKTDPLITAEVARNRLNREATPEEIEEALRIYAETLEVEIKDLSRARVEKGIPEILNELKTRPDVLLGILTGNIERGSDLKLNAFGLRKYFEFGAYSSDDPDRNNLVPVAVKKAAQILKRPVSIEGDSVVVIGDTAKDIECARSGGAYAVAVATGPFSVEELKAEKPDLVIANFEEGGADFLSFLDSLNG